MPHPISKKAGYATQEDVPKGPNGRPRCRICATEVAPPRRAFCCEQCAHLWRIKTDEVYRRRYVFKRDKGVCASCCEDMAAAGSLFHAHTENLRAKDKAAAERSGAFPVRTAGWIDQGIVKLRQIKADWCARHGFPPEAIDECLWDAALIKPTAEGGCEHELSNYQTLCISCRVARRQP